MILRENLGNAQELVEKFEEEYGEGVRRIKKNNIKKDREKELLGKYIAKFVKSTLKEKRGSGLDYN